MKNQEIVGCNGFGDLDPITQSQVELSKIWIREWITPRKTINTQKGSYQLKHIVEKNSGTYVSNGAFIRAAIDLGFNYSKNGLNAFFNMSFLRAKQNKNQSGYNLA